MKNRFFGLFFACSLLVSGCATVDVTKTAKGYFSPTKPDNVQILMTKVGQDYIELATVSTTNWHPTETAKMHNAMRAKTAPLGANAVLITSSGIIRSGNSDKMWTTGVAIKYKSEPQESTTEAEMPGEE